MTAWDRPRKKKKKRSASYTTKRWDNQTHSDAKGSMNFTRTAETGRDDWKKIESYTERVRSYSRSYSHTNRRNHKAKQVHEQNRIISVHQYIAELQAQARQEQQNKKRMTLTKEVQQRILEEPWKEHPDIPFIPEERQAGLETLDDDPEAPVAYHVNDGEVWKYVFPDGYYRMVWLQLTFGIFNHVQALVTKAIKDNDGSMVEDFQAWTRWIIVAGKAMEWRYLTVDIQRTYDAMEKYIRHHQPDQILWSTPIQWSKITINRWRGFNTDLWENIEFYVYFYRALTKPNVVMGELSDTDGLLWSLYLSRHEEEQPKNHNDLNLEIGQEEDQPRSYREDAFPNPGPLPRHPHDWLLEMREEAFFPNLGPSPRRPSDWLLEMSDI